MAAIKGPRDYEENPYWGTLDDYANKHLLYSQSSVPYKGMLDYAITNSEKGGLQSIEVAPSAGKHLSLLVKLMILNRSISGTGAPSTFNILEIGTLGAYSTIWLATADPSVHITTLEYDENTAKIARANIEHAGLSSRVTVLTGAALDVLPKIKAEVDAGTRPQFDFSFVDADKMNSWPYFTFCRDVSRTGALIAVDNVVMAGRPVDPNIVDLETGKIKESALTGNVDHWQHPTKTTMGNRRLFEEVGKDNTVEGIVVQTVSGGFWDGLLFAVKVA